MELNAGIRPADFEGVSHDHDQHELVRWRLFRAGMSLRLSGAARADAAQPRVPLRAVVPLRRVVPLR